MASLTSWHARPYLVQGMADPRKGEGMFRYETEMYKLNRKLNITEYKKYTLEVVVRESDWTITHFKYFD